MGTALTPAVVAMCVFSDADCGHPIPEPWAEVTPMNETNWRPDAQLVGMFDEIATWVVRGEHGAPVGQTSSLRDALIVASALQSPGREIVALVQVPGARVVVFQAQIARLIDARA